MFHIGPILLRQITTWLFTLKLFTLNFETSNFEPMGGSTTIRVHMWSFSKVPLAHFSLPPRAMCMFLIWDTHIPTHLTFKSLLFIPLGQLCVKADAHFSRVRFLALFVIVRMFWTIPYLTLCFWWTGLGACGKKTIAFVLALPAGGLGAVIFLMHGPAYSVIIIWDSHFQLGTLGTLGTLASAERQNRRKQRCIKK